jgi:hypothetical protein
VTAALGIGFAILRSRSGLKVACFALLAAFVMALGSSIALSLPGAFAGSTERLNERYPAERSVEGLATSDGRAPTHVRQRSTLWHGRTISIVEVAVRTGSPVPPGVRAWPHPGQSVVSPALGNLIAQATTDDAAELRRRIGIPATTISRHGLETPAELFAYRVVLDSELTPTMTADVTLIDGWGGHGLYRSDVSPYVALPLVALVLIPGIGLLAALFMLDGPRRARRSQVLSSIGARRRDRVIADAGYLLPPITLGWFAAGAVRRAFLGWLTDAALRGRVFDANDLALGPLQAGAIWMLIAGLVLSASSTQAAAFMPAMVAYRSRYALRFRLRTGTVAVVSTFAIAILIFRSPPDSALRDVSVVAPAVILLLTGVLVLVQPLVIVVAGRSSRTASGDVARARLATSRTGWRAAAISIVLVLTTGGIASSVLVVLDRSTNANDIAWEPGQLPPNAAFAVMRAQTLRAITHGQVQVSGPDSAPVPVVQIARRGSAAGPVESDRSTMVLVPCDEIDLIVSVPTETTDPCERAFVVAGSSVFEPPDAVDAGVPGRGNRRVSVAHPAAPLALLGSTGTVVLPVSRAVLANALAKAAPDEPVGAVYRSLAPAEVERLRHRLWEEPAAVDGVAGPLSNVVSKSDLQRDASSNATRYGLLVVWLLVIGSATAILAIGISAVAEIGETERRDAMLRALGAERSTVRRIHLTGLIVPALTSVALGALTGAALGCGYLALPVDGSIDNPFRAFPARRFAELTFVLVGLFAAAAVPAYIMADRRSREKHVGSLGV